MNVRPEGFRASPHSALQVMDAVADGLAYLDGLRDTGIVEPRAQAQALVEYLAAHGFLVRARNGAERLGLKPGSLDRCRISGTELRAMRSAAGLSLARLGAIAGVCPETIQRWEQGRTSPHLRKLKAVLDALAKGAAGIDRRP